MNWNNNETFLCQSSDLSPEKNREKKKIMSKSPWGKIGNWAAEAERAEAEEREAAEKAAASKPPSSFPSLKESVTTAKQKKTKKMSLQEFTMKPSSTHSGSASSRGLTPEEILRLPTGPKERSPDEMQHGRLGGGFSNYGSRPGSGGPNTGRPREYDGRRSYGFDDDNRRPPPPESRVSDLNQPSRADEVDNWASTKKQTLPDYDSRQDRPGGRYSSLGGGGGPGGGSRADEVDNWASVKKHFPQTQPARSSGFGSGFSRPESDRWARNEQAFGSGFPRPEQDRWTRNEQRSASDTDATKYEIDVGPKVNKPNPFGAARPREEVLAEKGLDWKKLDLEVEMKNQSSVSGGSRPMSSHSSRPGSQQSSRSDVPMALGGEEVVKERPKVNPFGNAKPREVLLEEKGLDWKKIDLELDNRRVERPETEEEKNLKEQIEHLKNELLKNPVEDQTAKHDLISQKERDLELLVRQLDDKVHYSQKIFERKISRPGSQDGQSRPPSVHGKYEEPNRPPSQPGSYDNSRERNFSRQGAYEEPRLGFRHGGFEDPRGSEYNERPRSRGTGNDRRSFGGRGFAGSREIDSSWFDFSYSSEGLRSAKVANNKLYSALGHFVCRL
ncbi:eukaryotic translation initiation factor 4Bfamily protein [Striga asiatica]|uniref:Eukaryotic translation initiation factor 4Bfamily protein n=1 Tax=Striga asiatica TaxID=4170 RepID=A0A5A7RFL8_STRAF|nr:eukaryotic translation initiation factor 4Bfamily protein [Striga asiatica]